MLRPHGQVQVMLYIETNSWWISEPQKKGKKIRKLESLLAMLYCSGVPYTPISIVCYEALCNILWNMNVTLSSLCNAAIYWMIWWYCSWVVTRQRLKKNKQACLAIQDVWVFWSICFPALHCTCIKKINMQHLWQII